MLPRDRLPDHDALTVSVIGLYVLIIGGLGDLLQGRCMRLLSVAATGVVAVLIGEVFARFIGSSEHRFRCAAWTAHDRCLLIRWELTAPGLPVAGSGVNMLLFGQDGRIEADYQDSPTRN